MPKTFTDDIAAVLPSSIDGPFQVADPSDPTATMAIDPAAAKIAIAGAARPIRMLTPGYVNAWGSGGAGAINRIAAREQTASFSGGFYIEPIRIPADMDVGEPSTLRILIATAVTGPATEKVVRLDVRYSVVSTTGGTASDLTVTFDWTPPLNWATTDVRAVVIDNGNGWTFNGGSFANLDYLGIRIGRTAADPADTYPEKIKIASAVPFEYTAKQF